MSQEAPDESRSARKRRAIVEAAAGLFLAHGYQGTSMDEIAALAAVSKQTVYKNFSDKEQLFSDIVLAAAARADDFIQALPRVLAGTDDLRPACRSWPAGTLPRSCSHACCRCGGSSSARRAGFPTWPAPTTSGFRNG